MKVWHALAIQAAFVLIALAFWIFWAWLFLSLIMSGARVITGACTDPSWVNNWMVNTAWFCK